MTVNASHRRSLVDMGRAVRAARERRRTSITDIAKRGGCAPNTWAKVERGEPVQPDMYGAIARGFGVPMELVINAVESVEHLPKLVEAIGAAAAYFPDVSQLDDSALFDMADGVQAEIYRRFMANRDALNRLTR